MTSTDDVAEHAARDAERMVKMSAIRALAIAGYRISIEFSDGSVAPTSNGNEEVRAVSML